MSTENTIRPLGGVSENRTARGTRFEVRYYVAESALADFLPEIGDEAGFTPEKAFVSAVSKTWLAEGAWLVSIRAEMAENADALAGIGIFSGGPAGRVECSYGVAQLHFPAAWFGCRIAGHDDCSPFTNAAQQTLPEGALKYKNIRGQWAGVGDYLFRNAVPMIYDGESGSATAGTADDSRSPFSGEIPLAQIGQTLPTRIFRCVFRSRRSVRTFSHFRGVNGVFSNQCRPDTSAAGCWKALSQTVGSMRGSDGRYYAKVERTMMEAPANLRWSAEKNGGIWTW